MNAIENHDEDENEGEDMGEESITKASPIMAQSEPISLQFLTKALKSSSDNESKSER